MLQHPGSSSLHHFNEEQFERQVDAALSVVKTILDTTRNPRHAADEDHAYSDKYGLADFLTNTGIAAALNVLDGLGLDAAKLQELQNIRAVDKRTVTLRFKAEVTCEFDQETVVGVGTNRNSVAIEKTSKQKESFAARVSKLLTNWVDLKVTEYHWRVRLDYVIYAYLGNDSHAPAVVLQHRRSHVDVVTTGNKESPLPAKDQINPVDTPLTWLLENISPDGSCSFCIDRSLETCHTPRRNEDVSNALRFFHGMKDWSEKIRLFFVRKVESKIILWINRGDEPRSAQVEAREYLYSVSDECVFVPVLPLFENIETRVEAQEVGNESEPRFPAFASQSRWERSPLLSVADVNSLLSEETRSLDEKTRKIKESFPSMDGHDMVSAAEAIIVLLALHMQNIAKYFADGVDYIENMLKKQLIKAIGKEVQARDFAEYVRFHDQKLLKDGYAPQPFSYAIRRPNRSPEGVLSIEKRNLDSNVPIMSITRELDGEVPPVHFPINATTSVEFTGDRYLHAWVSKCFAGRQENSYHLMARARQFSSFLLLVGKISGPNSFEPQDAIILQNGEDILVPLLLNQLPSPKDFKDSISSLSPEQKRFATAYRNMQLESSVFAVCCIQLKPQLEALLGLPSGALTKEIELTQDLLSLFIDYQIPSDLLSFNGADDLPKGNKVAVIKGHVRSVMKVIEEVKEKELDAAQKEAATHYRIRDTPTMSDNKLYCALVFRLEAGPQVSATLLAKYDHASQYKTHGGTSADAGTLYGSRDKNHTEAVGLAVGNDPPGKMQEPGILGGFKVVQSEVHQVVYGADTDGLCLAVVAGLQYPPRIAIQMLVELYGQYSEQFGLQAKSAATNSLTKNSKPMLSAKCKKYDDLSRVDKLSSLIGKIDEVKVQMQDNIDAMLKNTEKAVSLVERSDTLNEQSSVFKKKSTNLHARCRWIPPVMKMGQMVSSGRPSPPSVPNALSSRVFKETAHKGVAGAAEAHLSCSQEPLSTEKPESPEGPVVCCAEKTEAPEIHTEGEKAAQFVANEHQGLVDFTQIPKMLDSKLEELDSDNMLCPTVVKTGDYWTKVHSKSNTLTTVAGRMVLNHDGRKTERDRAFDLLDALSRSGSLPLECAELHMIVAVTHNFDHSLMETVIQDNINPIEKMERSTLIVASTIHSKEPEELMRDPDQVSRVKQYCPGLFVSC